MKRFFLMSLVSLALFSCAMKINPAVDTPISVAFDGNSYVTQGDRTIVIDKNGVTNWTSENQVVSMFFKLEKPGELNVALVGKGEGSFAVEVEGVSKDVVISSDTTIVGIYNISKAGYVEVVIKGKDKSGQAYPTLTELLIGGESTTGQNYYVKDFSTYWGRRGPSVHMKYDFPKEDVRCFYNEVTVADGNDVVGSYFMANGFGEGYFGIQVNSDSERRVLFSVWSPYQAEDPKDIPEEYRVVLLRKGEGVYVGEFGNEGSGGQSYLKYNWKAGKSYKFLTEVVPDGKGATIYTSYFYSPDDDRWMLIASFKRPKTDTHYTRAYSFLENFIPEQGYITRKVGFDNQWVLTTNDEWIEVLDATFTYDATAKAGVRQDYSGGIGGNDEFFLRSFGFFNDNTEYNTRFTRKAKGNKPQIDFDQLKSL